MSRQRRDLMEVPRLDLLIIDIDNVFIYHRTVAIANRILVNTVAALFKAKPDQELLYTTRRALAEMIKIACARVFCFRPNLILIRRLGNLAKAAVTLYLLDSWRTVCNGCGVYVSNQKMIRVWVKTVLELRISAQEYTISEESLKRSLDPAVIRLYTSIKRKNPGIKVIAISQHFSVGKNSIQSLLHIDMMETNKWVVKKGKICGYTRVCSDKDDKRRIAGRYISRQGARKVGLFVEDYDELGLFSLPNLAAVYYGRKMRRFLPPGVAAVRLP